MLIWGFLKAIRNKFINSNIVVKTIDKNYSLKSLFDFGFKHICLNFISRPRF